MALWLQSPCVKNPASIPSPTFWYPLEPTPPLTALQCCSAELSARRCRERPFLLVGIPPTLFKKTLNGQKNKLCLIKNETFKPEANNTKIATTKSQFDEWGARTTRYFFRLGKSPQTCQPINFKPVRPNHFENALPDCGD